MSERLLGKRALLTGAGGGLVSEIARRFAAEGASMILAGRTLSRVADVAAETSSTAVEIDVTDSAAVAQMVTDAHAALGGLDIVVNGAAIDTGWAPSADMDIAIWDATIAANLSGSYYVCRAAIPLMIEGGGGSIVNITSVAGHKAWPEDVAYNASKAGVTQMSRTMAVEYATAGIRVNCLAPGVIDAGLTDTVTDPAERETLIAMHPMARMGTTAEVAEAAVWLASDASSFTTAWTVAVDGGFLA